METTSEKAIRYNTNGLWKRLVKMGKRIECKKMIRYRPGEPVRFYGTGLPKGTFYVISTYRQHGGGGVVVLDLSHQVRFVHATGKKVVQVDCF